MRTATKHISILSIIAAVLTFAVCAAAQSAIEGKWKISGYNFSEKRAFPLDRMDVTLIVGPDMKVGGRSACNLYSGSITFGPGGAMKLGSITMTEMACNEINGTFEGEFLEVLSKASNYEVKGKMLTITDAGSGHFLKFTRANAPAPPPTPQPEVQGVREVLFIGNKMSKCSGIAPLKCLLIKREKGGAWQDYFDSIIGFSPKPGRFYKIEVEQMGDRRSARPGIFRLKLVRILKSSTREKDIYR